MALRVNLRIVHDHRSRRNAKTMPVDLVEPKDDYVCPISQGPMPEAELECLPPDSVFAPDRPELTGMRLQCGHCFNAINVLYHFVRNHTALCPVCRAGPKNVHVNIISVPQHIRARISRRAKAEHISDREEATAENQQAAVAIQLVDEFSMRLWISHYVSLGTCSIHLRYDAGPPHLRFPLSTHFFDNARVVFVVPVAPFVPRGSFTLLGACADTVFPPSVSSPATITHTFTGLSPPGTTTNYAVSADGGRIKVITWSLPIDFFFIIAQQV